MIYDYSKLNGKITEVYGSQRAFAIAMGLSSEAINKKLNNKTYWRQPDIAKACGLLEIEPKDIPIYFFNTKVQQN